MADASQHPRVVFAFPAGDDLKLEGGRPTVQVRVKEEGIENEVIKYAPVRLQAAGGGGQHEQPAKYFVARIKSGPGSRGWKVNGIKVDGLEQRGELPHNGRVRITCTESVLDDILTPMERSVKTYLTSTLSRDLIELLAVLAVERPDDAHLWLASKLLERSPGGPFVAVKRSALLAKKGGAAPASSRADEDGGGRGGGGGSGGGDSGVPAPGSV